MRWTNNYYLGRITSDWRYESEIENVEADVVNITICDWFKIRMNKKVQQYRL